VKVDPSLKLALHQPFSLEEDLPLKSLGLIFFDVTLACPLPFSGLKTH